MHSLASASNWVIDRVSRRLRIGRAGAVALVTAICAPILVMIVGFVIDFSYASYINQRLARATDAATLGSVSQTAATAGGGYGDLAFLQTMGTNYFNANTLQLGVSGVNFSLSVTADGSGGVIANGSYNYNVPTFFAGILGINSIPISGNAKTVARPLTYINYYILVDNSQSMGIGTTQADMTALYQRVLANTNASPIFTSGSYAPGDGGCVFGCHTPQIIRVGNGSTTKYQPVTNEDLAHNTTKYWGTPITLRIDSAISAVNSIVSSAAQIAGTTKNIKFGIYTIGEDTNTGKGVQFITNPPSTNYSSIQTSVSSIDLVNTDGSQSTGNTDFDDEVADFLAGVPTLVQGNGASATSPLNYIFLVTDGLNDIRGACNVYNLCTAPINATDCTLLKANATVGVIYTTYLPIYQYNTGPTLEDRFNKIVTSSKPALAKAALQSCATSSDWFFEAQDGPTLIASMQALFLRTQPVSARISQ